ncbi:MAG: 50S ribosomal protein L17 [Phycisphaerae bacterium]
MRHAVRGRKLARTASHRLAMRRNMVQSLIEHGEIRTTWVKAKEMRSFAEKIATLAIDGSLAARQRAEALLNDRAIIPKDKQETYEKMTDAARAKVLTSRSGRRYRKSITKPGIEFTAESVLNRLFTTVGPALKKRNEAKSSTGGYTRIIPLADRRLGDGSRLAIIQWVSSDDTRRPKRGEAKTERRRKSELRYAAYAGKVLPNRNRRKSSKSAKSDAAST